MEQSEAGRAMIQAAKDKPWTGLQGFARANPRLNVLQQVTTPEVRQSAWQKEVDAAEKNNIPGTFTTLFAWEWTAMIGGKNLHRNVISNATAQQASQFIPYAAGQFYSLKGVDSNRPEDLWAWLDATSKRVGVDFIAIPAQLQYFRRPDVRRGGQRRPPIRCAVRPRRACAGSRWWRSPRPRARRRWPRNSRPTTSSPNSKCAANC